MTNRLFVDMDGTLAVFKNVDALETLYEQGYFLNLEPHRHVIEAVKRIINETPDIEVFILSSVLMDSQYALKEKNQWLDKYLPEINKEHRLFPPCGQAKKDFIPGGINEKDWLLDDYTNNLKQWQPPGRGIKLLNGINHTRKTWDEDCIRFDKPSIEMADNIVSVIQDGANIQDQTPQETQMGTSFSPQQRQELTSQMRELGYEAVYIEGSSDDFLMWESKESGTFGLDGWEGVQDFLDGVVESKELTLQMRELGYTMKNPSEEMFFGGGGGLQWEKAGEKVNVYGWVGVKDFIQEKKFFPLSGQDDHSETIADMHSKPVTEKQINYSRKIAEKLGLEMPEQNWKAMSDFIAKNRSQYLKVLGRDKPARTKEL